MAADSAALEQAQAKPGNDLESLLERINRLASGEEVEDSAPSEALQPVPPVEHPAEAEHRPSVVSTDASVISALHAPSKVQRERQQAIDEPWMPMEPQSLEVAGVTEGLLEHLVLKFLGACGDLSGRDLAEQHSLPFRLVEPILAALKQAQLVAFRGAAPMNDYVYQLTDMGRETAKKLTEYCSYFGTAPVPLQAYITSVGEQTLTKLHPTEADLERAFSDLLINKRMLRRLGPAVNSGRGLFLFGAPGNGKTSIAERVTKAFGDTIWIPRAIGIDGEIMRVFDPGLHEEVPMEKQRGPLQTIPVDKRWVRIRRPTIVVGGELTMDALEVTPSTGVNVSEAPLQLKSNCGTLVIDDFGRQRMTTDQLLNRWIVPLEKRYDFLRLVNGKKIQVPFDQLIIFSTNLEPRDLVDDAFLRRIPYKIEVTDPTEDEFRELFVIMSNILGMQHNEESVDYLIDKHYKSVNRPFRCCQPRDLLLQIRNYCHYLDVPPQMCHEYFDYAVENYFAVM
jgi:hypothetical protein